jgi:hypothetical protein
MKLAACWPLLQASCPRFHFGLCPRTVTKMFMDILNTNTFSFFVHKGLTLHYRESIFEFNPKNMSFIFYILLNYLLRSILFPSDLCFVSEPFPNNFRKNWGRSGWVRGGVEKEI